MYKHILFATELHDSKSYIEDKVAQLQQFTEAKLSIIHVVEPIPNYGGALGVVPGPDPVGSFGNTEKRKEQAKEILQPLAKRLNITEQDLCISVGYISEEILAFAEHESVDLIITGSHGVHGLRLLLGSTANAILHGAKCDVLAVRYKEQ
jgi:universal stress protein A